MIYVIVALAVSHSLVLIAGGYLHYRYGKTVLAVAAALENIPK